VLPVGRFLTDALSHRYQITIERLKNERIAARVGMNRAETIDENQQEEYYEQGQQEMFEDMQQDDMHPASGSDHRRDSIEVQRRGKNTKRSMVLPGLGSGSAAGSVGRAPSHDTSFGGIPLFSDK
jgi:hypothetical protein